MHLFLRVICIALIGVSVLLPLLPVPGKNEGLSKVASTVLEHQECPCHAGSHAKALSPILQQNQAGACFMCCQHPWSDYAGLSTQLNLHSSSEFYLSLVQLVIPFSHRVSSQYLSMEFSPAVPPPEKA